MGFLDRLVSDVIKQSTGFNARPFVRAVGGKNVLLLGGAAVAAALAADKMKGQGQGQQSQANSVGQPIPPLPPSSGGNEALPPLPGNPGQVGQADQNLPPLPGAGPAPASPPTPAPAADAVEQPPQELVYAIVRTMIAAALADGEMHTEEKKLIEGRLGESGLSPEQMQQVHKDLVIPAGPTELASLVSEPSDKENVLRFAALVVLSDQNVTATERAWLDQLANALGIDTDRARAIQQEIFST